MTDRTILAECLRFLAGTWPTTEMSEAEVRAWTLVIQECQPKQAKRILVEFRNEGMTFRPNPSQFAARRLAEAAHERQVERDRRLLAELSNAEYMPRESWDAGMAEVRRTLRHEEAS